MQLLLRSIILILGLMMYGGCKNHQNGADLDKTREEVKSYMEYLARTGDSLAEKYYQSKSETKYWLEIYHQQGKRIVDTLKGPEEIDTQFKWIYIADTILILEFFYVLNDTSMYLTEKSLRRIPQEGIPEWLGPTVLIVNTQNCSILFEDSNKSNLYQEIVRNASGKTAPKHQFFIKTEEYLNDSVLLKIAKIPNIYNCVHCIRVSPQATASLGVRDCCLGWRDEKY